MFKSNNAGDRQQDLLELWVAIGRLALGGKLSLEAIRWGCQLLVVRASSWRNGRVKARSAVELGTTRKTVRGFLEDSARVAGHSALVDELLRRSRREDNQPEAAE